MTEATEIRNKALKKCFFGHLEIVKEDKPPNIDHEKTKELI